MKTFAALKPNDKRAQNSMRIQIILPGWWV
jgi:hypothetical protein